MAISDGDTYRIGSLGDLIERLVDGWEIVHMHYADVAASDEVPNQGAAAFIDLRRADAGIEGLFIPDDERTYSNRALIALFREAPHIWKHRTAHTIREQLAKESYEGLPAAESWGDVPDPADRPLDVSPGALRGVVALGNVESIDNVTVALLSLERYEDFSRVRYLAHTSDAMLRGSLAALDVLIVDDRGRRYRTASLGVERFGNRVEGTMALAPGIPRDATALTVTIGTIGEGGPDGFLGPWVFPIRLPTPPPA